MTESKKSRNLATHDGKSGRSESRQADLARIVEGSLNEMCVFDEATLRVVEINRSARENLQYSIEELERMTPVDIKPEFTSDTCNDLVEPLRSGRRNKIVFESKHRRKDETIYPVEVHLQLGTYSASRVFIAIILDITSRKLAEDALKRSESSLARAEELAMIGHWSWDIRANTVAWSDQYVRMVGLNRETFAANYEACVRCVHPDDVEFFRRAMCLFGGVRYRSGNVGTDPEELI